MSPFAGESSGHVRRSARDEPRWLSAEGVGCGISLVLELWDMPSGHGLTSHRSLACIIPCWDAIGVLFHLTPDQARAKVRLALGPPLSLVRDRSLSAVRASPTGKEAVSVG